MITPRFSRPAHSCALLCAAALLAACGNGGEANRNRPTAPAVQSSAEPDTPAPTTPSSEPAHPSSGPAQTEAFPLSPGVYVVAGSSCATPANAAFRIFDGRGISGSATRGCRLTVRSRDGDEYRVDQSCEDTYSGERTTASQTINVPNAQSFTLTEQGETATRFRLCPKGEAPDYLEDLATAD